MSLPVPPDRPPTRRVEVVIGARTLAALAAFGLLIALALLSLGTLISIFLAAVVAFGLDPVVGALVRRGWSRGIAACAVLLAVFVAVLLLVVLAIGPVWREVVEFLRAVPGYWEQFASSDLAEEVFGDTTREDVRAWLGDLVAEVPGAASTVLGAAGSVFGSVLSLVTLVFLTLFLLMERPTITRWLFGFTPPEVEARWAPVVERSITAVSQSLLGNIAISVIAGTLAGVSSWLLGLPFPVVLGVITGLLDLIPQVGATIAAVVLTFVALTVSLPAAIATVCIQLVYQQVENYVIYPLVYKTAVELSAFTTIVAVLLFSAILGVAGAILAVPFAAVIKVVVAEATRPRREAMAALRADDASAA